jgi:diketogulonate reductase-like aldo/keto reductase
MREVECCGRKLPVIAQGTWRMGERRRQRDAEVEALRLGFELGMTVVDSAEMYADGGAEEVVGEAIAGRRSSVFVVTKVLPENATFDGTLRAAERSLKRLRTDWIDLYLLHWEGAHPLADTLRAFAQLREEGRVRAYGVSNFDVPLLERALAMPHGDGIAGNQVLYNLGRRGIEHRLLPECRRRGILVQAYTPLEPLRGLGSSSGSGGGRAAQALARVADRLGAAPAQVALAWTIREGGVMAIAKAATAQHVRDNAAAAELALSPQDLDELDAAFPRPSRPGPLETL